MLLQPETNIPAKRTKFYLYIAAFIVLAFGAGFLAGNQSQIKISNGKIEINRGNAPATSADYSLLWEALDQLNNKFVETPLDQQKLLYGAVSGLVNAAGDPYTVFLDPEQSRQFNEQLRGSFEGIGAEIGIKDGQIIVVAPLEDTPAERAGLLPGDAILEINGESTFKMSTDQAVNKIRGKSGTPVKLNILHKGKNESQEVSITRAKIEIKSVKLETKEVGGKKIAVIKINQFGDDTEGLMDRTVDQVSTGNFFGLIVDLRNNPGGYLPTAVDVVSNWIDEGQVALKEIDRNNKENNYKTEGVPRLKGMKTIILVNGGSASASEIVAGALQDYQVATLVGEQTYGKGSVQELISLRNDSEVKVTVAKWFTPKGRGIDKTGLEPDIKVERTDADFEADRDPQMDKALELLK